MVTPAVKREAVAHLKAHFGLSERRACEIAGADRKMVRYQSQRAPDTALRGRLRDLAKSGAGSATGGSLCCSGGRARRLESTASTVSTARKG